MSASARSRFHNNRDSASASAEAAPSNAPVRAKLWSITLACTSAAVPPSTSSIAAAGGIEVLVRALTAHPTAAGVQKQGFGGLCNLGIEALVGALNATYSGVGANIHLNGKHAPADVPSMHLDLHPHTSWLIDAIGLHEMNIVCSCEGERRGAGDQGLSHERVDSRVVRPLSEALVGEMRCAGIRPDRSEPRGTHP